MQALRQGDPRTFGRYRILARIGAGGMAIVYFGRSRSGRAVAVKAIHAEFAVDEAYRDRFRREVAATKAAGGRYSPGVVEIDLDAAIPWLAMEFLPAVSLREAVNRYGVLAVESAWPLAAGLVEALASIHGAGVVHLDLKPANVLLTTDGPRVIDFGIARIGPPRETPAGTPGFSSPEQAAGGPVGSPGDVYSFGATLGYALTGRQPSGRKPPPIADDGLRTMIESCLRHDTAARPTVAELAAGLAEVSAGGPHGTGRLPDEVAAEIARRTEEAEHPPVAPDLAPPPRRPSRRQVLVAGAAVVLAGGGVGLPAIFAAGRRPVAGAAAPEPGATPTTTTTSVVPIDLPPTKPMEVILSGTVVLHAMTLTVNGQAVQSLTNVPLPWRTFVDVPMEPEPTWQIDYQCSAGDLNYDVSIPSGSRWSGGGGTSYETTDVFTSSR